MTVISRADWGARRPKTPPSSITYSEPTTAHWEGPSLGYPFDHAHCYDLVRSIQNFHMDSRGWNDIAYNAVACPHGDVFEGRGPNVRSAANGTNYSNGSSPAVCFLAGEGDEFTPESKAAFLEACDWLGNPPGHVHSDWFNTSCPGDERRDWVRAGCPVEPAPAPAPQPQPEPAPEPVPAPTPQPGVIDVQVQELSEGSDSGEVGTVQAVLNGKAGARLSVDNDFGPRTAQAVRNWQASHGLDVDAVVGPITWASLVDA